MSIPNSLTALRILSIPILIAVLLSQFDGKNLVAFAIFLLAALTDMLDGFFARRKKQTSVFGQLLDPLADKLLITAAFICLVELGAVSAWMVIVIIGREIAVTGFRAIASSKGINISASLLGKIKMILETITISILILGEKILGQFYFLSRVGLWLVIAAAIISAAEYYIRFGPAVFSENPR
jgi:CDP-diacylglycerol--glycerol-3-phosphate 3-phosphatidyltransferase